MKVYLGTKASANTGGMYRVYDLLYKHLSKYDVEIVNTIEEADVVHAHIALWENVPVDKPLVVSSHGLLWDDVWGDGMWGNNLQLIDAYRQADVVTAPSYFVSSAIARNMLIDAKIVHHGIDPEEWQPGTPQGYVLWNKARVDAANVPADMNRLAELAPDIQFISTFGEPAPNVRIIGLVSPEEMKTLVQNASVYLDTAKESGGPCFGVLEAMSCGVPVLAWNEGGNAEAVRHLKTGYLAHIKDFQDLLNGLKHCFSERKNLGNNARKVLENNYTYEMTCKGYIEAYKQAISKHSHTVKVSVVVPVYNLADYLPMCLDSILEQTFTDWEAIIVNDQSPDDALKIAQSYVAKDSRFKLLNNKENLHVSESRNRGIVASKGQYILPLDADDRLTPSALEVMVHKLDSDRSINIVTGTLLLYNDGHFEGEGLGYNGWPNTASYQQQIEGQNRLPYASMYRRKVWDNIGGYRRRIRNGVEDGDFWTRALSYGYKAEVIQHHTLRYTLRNNSLRSANPYGVDAWLTWFPWSRNPEITPFGALCNHQNMTPDRRNGPYRIRSNKPLVSVVIPVGPGHTHHIQGCVDSLIAQTNPDWEAVVVNDTGQRWFDDDNNPLTQHVQGMPFVRFLDFESNHGVAFARNQGIINAKADRIILLDVDDILQPDAIDVLVQAQDYSDGWIYGDWYVSNGDGVTYSEAPDWTMDGLTGQSLAPITGIYWKQHLLDAGLFDEAIRGWEDWDLQLKLLEQGVCGTRIKYPLITYNMHYGNRREDNFADKKNLIQSIKDRHNNLYNGRVNMGCSKCGGRPSLNVTQQTAQAQNIPTGQVMVKYVGPMGGQRHMNGIVHNGRKATYLVNKDESFAVLPHDVDYILSHAGYVLAETLRPAQPVVQSVTMPLTSQAPVKMETVVSLDSLPLKSEVITILKTQFSSVNDLRIASDADLLAIKGIGPARVKELRKVLAGV